jgi:hypothetical protein
MHTTIFTYRLVTACHPGCYRVSSFSAVVTAKSNAAIISCLELGISETVFAGNEIPPLWKTFLLNEKVAE